MVIIRGEAKICEVALYIYLKTVKELCEKLRYCLLKDNKDIPTNILSQRIMLKMVQAAGGIGTSQQQH